MKRAFVSLMLALVLVVMVITSLRLLFGTYKEQIVILHVIGGFLFLIAVGFHLVNNTKSLRAYLLHRKKVYLPLAGLTLFFLLLLPTSAFSSLSEWYFGLRVGQERESISQLEVYDMADGFGNIQLSVKSGIHFWYPQIAVWVENKEGVYQKTLMVTYSTAKGVFYGNRTKQNFKDFDGAKVDTQSQYRRVDALPHWSHQRGVIYEDSFYAPTNTDPLPDAVSGATPSSGFQLFGDVDLQDTLTIKMEVNVAFDENAYYSEFSFPEDEQFHSGTGLLGQPSLIYEAQISPNSQPVLMTLVGHGHHSGEDGTIYDDLSGITTAKKIIDWIVVEVNL